MYAVFRATNPGPGFATLDLTALLQGREVWRDSFVGWWDNFHQPKVGQFLPHTVERVPLTQMLANEGIHPDTWGQVPAADPIGPMTRTIVCSWPDQACDLFHVYPLILPNHDQLTMRVRVYMAADNGKIRVFLGVITPGHQSYIY